MVLEGRGCHGVSSAGCEPVTRVRVHVTPPQRKVVKNTYFRSFGGVTVTVKASPLGTA